MDCPNYIAPKYYVDPDTEEDFEAIAMCKLTNKPCEVESWDNDYEEYLEYLREHNDSH